MSPQSARNHEAKERTGHAICVKHVMFIRGESALPQINTPGSSESPYVAPLCLSFLLVSRSRILLKKKKKENVCKKLLSTVKLEEIVPGHAFQQKPDNAP